MYSLFIKSHYFKSVTNIETECEYILFKLNNILLQIQYVQNITQGV